MYFLNYPYTVHSITLPNGERIAYFDEGEGEVTLLFIHGLGSYAPAWQKNIEDLRVYHRCIALDLPGYPKSEKPENYPYSMEAFAKTITALADALALRNVVLVGHSMGGQIALTAVLQSPERFAGLVLVAPAGIERFSETEAAWLKANVTPTVIKNTPQEQIKMNFEVNFAAGKLPDDAFFMYEDRLRIRSNVEEHDFFCELIPKCVAAMLDAPVFEQLNGVNVPTLVLFGTHDYLIPNKYLHPDLTVEVVAAAAQNAIPRSELFFVPNAGHFAMWDNPTFVNNKILTFLIKFF